MLFCRCVEKKMVKSKERLSHHDPDPLEEGIRVDRAVAWFGISQNEFFFVQQRGYAYGLWTNVDYGLLQETGNAERGKGNG